MSASPSDEHKKKLSEKLKKFQEKALRVDTRSPSIFLRRIYDKKSFDITSLERFEELHYDMVDLLLKGKKNICMMRSSDDSEKSQKDSAKLLLLSRYTKLVLDETGQLVLYFGFPFFEGHINDFAYVRAPLILFPIKLEYERAKKPNGWYIYADQDRTPILNKALFAYLKRLEYTQVPESLQDDILDLLDEIASLEQKSEYKEKFWQGLYKILDSFDFRYDKNYDISHAEPIVPLTREESAKIPKQKIHLKKSFVIGQFPQGHTAIFGDYDALIKKASEGEVDLGIIDELLEIPAIENQWISTNDEQLANIDLDKIPDREFNAILPSDSSQDAVIIATQSQPCTVVRGPPGTGKSQVIVNLISNALSKNQKVLLACRKRPALDVVFQRLDSAGLGDYIQLVEDQNKDKLSIYRKFRKIAESDKDEVQYSATVDLNRTSVEIDKLIERQSNLVRVLAKKYFDGISVHELYVNAKSGYIPKLKLAGLAEKITIHQLDNLIEILPTIQASSIKFGNSNHPWYHRKDFTNFTTLEQNRLQEEIVELISLTQIDMLDYDVHTLNKLQDSFEIIKTKTGFRSLFNKEKHQATFFVQSIFGKEIKKEELDLLIRKTLSGINLRYALDKLKQVVKDEFVEYLKSQSLATIKKTLESMNNTIEEIPEIQNYEYKLRDIEGAQKSILKICTNEQTVHGLPWQELVRDEVYAYWIDYIEKENPILQGKPFESYIIQKERLRQLIKEKRNILRQKLITDIKSNTVNVPKYKRNKSPEQLTWSKFAAEVGKQRRLRPLRKLFEDYRSFVFGIAPCWLATPDSVSDIFPLEKGLFDLIIYDEASQCAVEDALPSMYRGKRIIIAGDEKQLRPFDLFQIKEEYEDEEDESIISESLFVLAKRIYGFRYLNWHYRSKYQDLIDFSNHAFYDGRLQVAPNVIRKPKNPPIRWICCNGTWNESTNLVEAKQVADEIMHILVQYKENEKFPSIGVITFNEPQQMAVLDEIERKREEDSEFDELMVKDKQRSLDDQIFVKNIENVQGDERDIIIFSVAYARDPEGVFRLQFGTLNQDGGENRLNVAVTRARQEIIMIVSIEPSDIKPDQVKNSGRQRLRDYLSYAQAISQLDEARTRQILSELNEGFLVSSDNLNYKLFDSKFEELVCNRLEALNYAVATQVGYSGYRIDLAVVHPEDQSRYILGIECDGANFHSAKSTRERDVMRQEFLEDRGWKIERIWSHDWWRDPQKEIDRIVARIEELRKLDSHIARE